jgi:hypothetical protein
VLHPTDTHTQVNRSWRLHRGVPGLHRRRTVNTLAPRRGATSALARRTRRHPVVILWALAVTCGASSVLARSVAVRYPEGTSHGFLQLHAADGTTLADGALTQHRRGSRVTSRLRFDFRDGSLYEDTTTFEEGRQLRLLSDHVVQRGPAFPTPMDVLIDAPAQQVRVRYSDKGEVKTETEHIAMPADLANGLISTLLRNLPDDTSSIAFSYIAATPKPRLVKLVVSTAGRDPVTVGAVKLEATHYVVHVEIGGVTGVLATVLGKQPPDSHVWLLRGDPPAFIRAAQPFYSDGPLWRVDVVMPSLEAKPIE